MSDASARAAGPDAAVPPILRARMRPQMGPPAAPPAAHALGLNSEKPTRAKSPESATASLSAEGVMSRG